MEKNRTTISQRLLELIEEQGCKSIFGVPGAYSIHFVDTCTSAAKPLDFILSSHEGGAAFMAQGYSQVTRALGCVVTTAGPAVLNTVAAMASAKSDGDRVLLIHGENPQSKRGQGSLQDATCFGCEVKDVVAPVVHHQFVIDSASDFASQLPDIAKVLAEAGKTTHLMIGADVFQATASPAPAPDDSGEKPHEAFDSTDSIDRIVDLMLQPDSMLVLAGHGIYQADAIKDFEAFLDDFKIPALVSARAAACLDPQKNYYIGQHSIFAHERVSRFMQNYGGRNTNLLLVIGSSLGEFSSNGGASYLREIPNIVHINTDGTCFGRLGSHALNLRMDAKIFLTKMKENSRLSAAKAVIQARNQKRLDEFRSRNSMNLYARLEEDLAAKNGERTGQRIVYAVSQALGKCLGPETVVNIVADTGSAKLYAAHYMAYRPGSRCLMNSGTIDCLGFGLSAAIGAAIGSRDMQEDALTVCFAGDGGMLMNNELNTLAANASLKGLRLIVFVLNDGALSYVHQGFAAVMGRPLAATRFQRRVDFAKMATAFGLSSAVVEKASEITPAFIANILAKEELPFIVDCRISNKVVGPGLSRYNQVRTLLGKPPLSPSEMKSSLS